MTVPIVGVHGINCYRYYKHAGTPEAAATEMAAGWTAALAEGTALAEDAALPPEATAGRLAVAYYSHLLRKQVTAQGANELKWLDPAEQAILTDLLSDLGAPAQIAQGGATLPFRQIGSWLDDHLPGVTNATVAAFCREVEAYLGSPDPKEPEVVSEQRKAVRNTVAATIAEHRPRAVVAHSLGSVVAYETLWEYQDLEVDLLLTIGSPLGLRGVVQARLLPRFDQATGRGARPPGVKAWVNVADKGDLVARTGSLAGSFDGVTQLPDISIGKVAYHAATAYLRHPVVAAQLAPYLEAPQHQ
jgi:hypothetical protein